MNRSVISDISNSKQAEKNTPVRLVPLSSGETILIVDDEEAVRKRNELIRVLKKNV